MAKILSVNVEKEVLKLYFPCLPILPFCRYLHELPAKSTIPLYIDPGGLFDVKFIVQLDLLSRIGDEGDFHEHCRHI